MLVRCLSPFRQAWKSAKFFFTKPPAGNINQIPVLSLGDESRQFLCRPRIEYLSVSVETEGLEANKFGTGFGGFAASKRRI